ncbi:MAG: DUF4126 domain-containing protein [Bryobacteraceae bacterium]
MPEWISTLGFAMGSAWLSGINLYATVATLGLLQRFQLVTLPGQLGGLGNEWVIGVAAALYVVEFVADKIPVVDSAWDMVHTFIRVPAGAVLAFQAFDGDDPTIRMIAMLLGGSVALTSHGAKTAVRVAANTSPEPFSNIALSLMEDLFTISSSVVLAWFPVVLLAVVVVFVVLAAWLAPKIFRALRGLFVASPPLAKDASLTHNR